MNNNYLIFLSGFVIYYILRISVKKIKDFLVFTEVFQHELTHTVFAFLTFKKVYTFNSSIRHGGNVKASSINPIIVLSPYTFPLFSIFLLALLIIVKPIYYVYILFFIGISFSQFFFTAFNDIFFSKQPDLRVYNTFVSYIIIIVSLLFYILYFYLGINYSLNIFIEIPKFLYGELI